MTDIETSEGQPFDLEDGLAILERTPAILRVWLEGLPAGWLSSREGPDTWSPIEVMAHLVYGEQADWIARVRQILVGDPTTPFEPFDRFVHLGGESDRTLTVLLDQFEELRRRNLAELRSFVLGEREMDLPGTHPEFGPVTLGQLLATWVTHDLSHIGQIARVMAKRNSGAVGPWAAYLSILRR